MIVLPRWEILLSNPKANDQVQENCKCDSPLPHLKEPMPSLNQAPVPHTRFLKATECLHAMRIVLHYSLCDKLKDARVYLVLAQIFLELVIGALEYNLLFHEGASSVEELLRPLIRDEALVLSHH